MITPNFNYEIVQGGQLINKRNYEILNNCCDKLDLFFIKDISNSDSCAFVRRMYTFFSIILYKNFYGINRAEKNKLLNLLKKVKYDICFLSSSLGGSIVFDIKRQCPDVKVIVFFHNLEYKFYWQLAERTGKYKMLLAFNAKKNERTAIKYADSIIALNNRDASEIKNLYKRSVDFILPTTFTDKYKNENISNSNLQGNKNLLFVGSNFYANFDAIEWFTKNVLPSLKNCTLNVVGKGTEEWRAIFKDIKNLNIVGAVDSLENYYEKADAVVLPIFLGSGMKTKTAEALMYGKYIFGTKEAFEGYDIDFNKIGGLCQDREAFINAIKKHFNVCHDKYNNYSRKMFIEKYSTDKYINKFKEFLCNLCNKNKGYN